MVYKLKYNSPFSCRTFLYLQHTSLYDLNAKIIPQVLPDIHSLFFFLFFLQVSGSKAGVVRYLGAAEFAKGEWCGVELDEPLGKNDGSVAGARSDDYSRFREV